MKRRLLVLSVLFACNLLYGQKKELIAKRDDKSIYLEHKVAAKETFYSIGRMYNLSPKTIAAYNKVDMNKGLAIDQKIRIPLNDSNFSQSAVTSMPVYHKVGDKDVLGRISDNYHISLSKLKSWNKISGDNIREGTKLVVGYLVTKENGSSITEVKNESKPADPVTEVVKEEKLPPVKTEVAEVKKEPETTDAGKPQPVVTAVDNTTEGYFKASFNMQVQQQPVTKNETVTSGIFKTTSGWDDGKYYLLIDNVNPGTLVRIQNPANNRIVYAKVLGAMTGIKQNEGLDIRISNAAASVLGITETDKFIVKVSY